MTAFLAVADVRRQFEVCEHLPVGQPLHIAFGLRIVATAFVSAFRADEIQPRQRSYPAFLLEVVFIGADEVASGEQFLEFVAAEDFRFSGLKSLDGLGIIQFSYSLHFSFLSLFGGKNGKNTQTGA